MPFRLPQIDAPSRSDAPRKRPRRRLPLQQARGARRLPRAPWLVRSRHVVAGGVIAQRLVIQFEQFRATGHHIGVALARTPAKHKLRLRLPSGWRRDERARHPRRKELCVPGCWFAQQLQQFQQFQQFVVSSAMKRVWARKLSGKKIEEKSG
jgi:hypothetical protein